MVERKNEESKNKKQEKTKEKKTQLFHFSSKITCHFIFYFWKFQLATSAYLSLAMIILLGHTLQQRNPGELIFLAELSNQYSLVKKNVQNG